MPAMEESLTPRQVFAQRMREVRNRRSWSMEELSKRLKELGLKLNASQIAKIETGSRDISLDEAIAIGVALWVSPLHLFIPTDEGPPVSLTPNFTKDRTDARAWVRGSLPLSTNEEDVKAYVTESPKPERQALANSRMYDLHLIYWALLEAGPITSPTKLEAAVNPLLEWRPDLSEMFEAIKPFIEKGRAEQIEQLLERAQKHPELLSDPELFNRVVADLRRQVAEREEKS
jgi:transcriptional regulator with XRE-family HTH domain